MSYEGDSGTSTSADLQPGHESWRRKCVAALRARAGGLAGFAKTVATNTAARLEDTALKLYCFEDFANFKLIPRFQNPAVDPGYPEDPRWQWKDWIGFTPPASLASTYPVDTRYAAPHRYWDKLEGDFWGYGIAQKRIVIIRRSVDWGRTSTPQGANASVAIGENYCALLAHEVNHTLNAGCSSESPPPGVENATAGSAWKSYRYFVYELRGNVVQDALRPGWLVGGKLTTKPGRRALLSDFSEIPLYQSAAVGPISPSKFARWLCGAVECPAASWAPETGFDVSFRWEDFFEGRAKLPGNSDNGPTVITSTDAILPT